jgi:hypothetical protein
MHGMKIKKEKLNESGLKLEKGFEFLHYQLPVPYFAQRWWELLILQHTGLQVSI